MASDSSVHTHNKMEYVLNRLEQVLPVVNINVEFPLDSVVHQDTSLNVHIVIFIVPVSLERDRYAVPSVWINVSQTVSYHTNDAFR